jgi:alpha-mannosidase
MRRYDWTCVCLLAALSMAYSANARWGVCADATPAHRRAAAELRLLWQIGKPDNNTAEFALAPDHFGQYKDDPLFIVGASHPKRDWPYVHPGPADPWAGSREHVFTILFALKQKPDAGNCHLVVDLADTHDRSPSTLEISINGRELLTHATPPGGPDDSIRGDPAKGREHRFTVEVPASAINRGTNEITLRTVSGSWVLYDWVGFEAPASVEPVPTEPTTLLRWVRCPPVLVGKENKLLQTVQVTILRVGPPCEVTIRLAGGEPLEAALKPGLQTVELPVPAVQQETPAAVEVRAAGQLIAERDVVLRPVRKWKVYLLPHSHVDIGYTELQTKVERDQWRFIEQAIEASRRTAEYPPGAQFKWNVEVLWAVDGYLRQATPEKQQEFVQAVQKGWIGLDALYGNELTALCRPEELARLLDYAQQLSKRCGVKIDSAMITDVPGYTWGLISLLGQSGVKYFSMGPNDSARIGFTHEVWDEKPFYWISPCGRYKVLCWIPEGGYYQRFKGSEEMLKRLGAMEAAGYPYDVVQVRYCLGDNAGPGLDLCETVKQWNAQHVYPKLIIGTTSQMMHEMERLHGDAIPQVRGDFTPYWEDGAASSALETGINRASAERLSQAEAIWALTAPRSYPADDFYAAWRNVILYDEHTWGAHNSISQPDSEFAQGQWKIKQAFALDGDKQSRALLAGATAPFTKKADKVTAVLVFNTASWSRTDLVVLSEELKLPGARVKGPDGKPAPSQRLSDGTLAFIARDVPPLGAKRFTIEPGDAAAEGSARAEGNKLGHARLRVALNETTGAIANLRCRGIDAELVDAGAGLGLNEYVYVPGTDPKDAKRCGPVKITVKEAGPLVASLLVECDAPGCRKLTREIRVIDGIDRVELINVVDKEKVRTKEGVHFAFPLSVAEGVMRMDIPWAVARPEVDQLPGACKNWFTVQRWIDTSNDQYGVTWATSDAPLVEVGSITAETPWIKTLQPTQTLYSYVMNNYWFTNYKADQEGPTSFRYSLRPHAGGYNAIEAARFGIEQSQPLVVVPCGGDAPATIPSHLTVDAPNVIVAALKPSADRQALILRLFNVAERAAKVKLTFGAPVPKGVWISDLAEEPQGKVTGPVDLPALGMVTLRAELPD